MFFLVSVHFQLNYSELNTLLVSFIDLIYGVICFEQGKTASFSFK